MKSRETFPSRLKDLSVSIAAVAGFLWERGWAEKNAGNISVDVSDVIPASAGGKEHNLVLDDPGPITGRTYLVTSAGSRMRDLARNPEDYLCVIQVANEPGPVRIRWTKSDLSVPTSELASHLLIHRALRKAGRKEMSVIHTHPEALIALTQLSEFTDEERINRVLEGMHPEVCINVPNGVGFVPYEMTGTRKLAELTVEALGSHSVALWEKHGCFGLGRTPDDAFDVIDTLEKAARIYFLVKSSGRIPVGLTYEQIAELKEKFGNAEPPQS
jgi:rhamnulose-1-phosphate aldolase